MSQDVLIFEVSHQSFPILVLQNSHKLPVLTAFLTLSSGSSSALEFLLSQLAREFAGRFIFAKVDIAGEPELRQQYHIEQSPTVIVFQDGKATRVELGQLNEDEARALLRDLEISHPSDLLREQARAKHLAGNTQEAILLLTEAIKQHPSNLRVALDMVQVFIDIGEFEQARSLLERLPEAVRNGEYGASLKGQLTVASFAANTEGVQVLQQRIDADPSDHASRFDLVVCLLAQHQPQLAMEHLLQIIRQDPTFKDGAARELMVSVINTLKPNDPELAGQYQRKLSNLLAS